MSEEEKDKIPANGKANENQNEKTERMKTTYLVCSVIILAVLCIILAIDKARMNVKFNDIGYKISEKSRYAAKLQDELDVLKNKFYVVTEKDVKDKENAFAQRPLTKEDEKTAAALAAKVKTPTPEEAKRVFVEYLEKQGDKKSSAGGINAKTGIFTDGNAAILEEMCRTLKLKANTVIFWDLASSTRRTLTHIGSDSGVKDDGKAKKSVLVAPDGMPDETRTTIRQFLPVTTVFSFGDLSVLSNKEKVIIGEDAKIPLGGLYVHHFRVFANSWWVLEYELPEGISAEENGMEALSIVSRSRITSSVSGNVISFRVSPFFNDSEILVMAKKPFFPVRVTAASMKARKNLGLDRKAETVKSSAAKVGEETKTAEKK